MVFALLHLLSYSTTVPLAAAKLRGPRDAFKKGFKKFFFELFENDYNAEVIYPLFIK